MDEGDSLVKGQLLCTVKRYASALEAFEEALRFGAEVGDRLVQAQAWQGKGDVLRLLDRHAEALRANEEALKLGADAVSVHINLGAEDEGCMIKDLGSVAKEAMSWGMPLLAMMYVRGPKVENPYDVRLVKHAARVAAELGADIVKVPYTGSSETFREVVEGCFVPVVIAGGEKMSTDEDILDMVRGSVVAGGAGVSIGRNVFQHRDPTMIVQAISKIVHNGCRN